MKSRILVVSIVSILFFSLQFTSSCKKINEGTTIGDNLIPVVDNITTFDTTMTVEAYNGAFTDLDDSTRLGSGAEHFIGHINSDPLFGKSDASLFLQLKPIGFPYYFHDKSDSMTSMQIDSVVLVLGYSDTYGDTNTVQTFRVWEMDNTNNFRWDSSYLVRSNTFTYSNPLSGTISIRPSDLNDSAKPRKETPSINQIRLRLNDNFGQRLLDYDSIPGSPKNAYQNDSIFSTKLKGFAIVPDASNGNALIGVNLLDTNTKLAIYYKWFKNNGSTPFDTTVRYFRFINSAGGTSLPSASANQVIRNYTGAQIQNYLSNSATTPDDLVFIQNTPGTYAKVKIPGLSTLSNRLIHRAELIVEQVYDPSDAIFTPPNYLFLDAYDSSLGKYRTIPFDFQIGPTGEINVSSFGMAGKPAIVNGNTVSTWHLNLTRYVQHIVTNHDKSYDLRLSSQYYLQDVYSGDPSNRIQTISINPTIAKGRVRVAGGNHASVQRMRLHIVYSKI